MAVLADGSVLSSREIGQLTGVPKSALWEALRRCWGNGPVLRSDKPVYEREKLNKGRAGRPWNLRPFHLYALKPAGMDHLQSNGHRLVGFSETAKDPRGGNGQSKVRKILEFLRAHGESAYFSKKIVEALKAEGVRAGDIMANLRRYERQGLVYVRGYRTNDHRSPFKEGFLITWIEQTKDRDVAMAEAMERTNDPG